MPDYDYKCKNCNEITVISKSMNDSSTPKCRNCGSGEVIRSWKKVQMKGCGSSNCSCNDGGCSSSCSGCG